MNITVILCTHNHCAGLPNALHGVAASILPASVEWEILVVDNNSQDHTRDVVEEFCRLYPGRFRYLFEPQLGKSHARNAGIREARGDVLVFLDDDVTVESNWLQNLTTPLNDNQWSAVGGRVILQWPSSVPGWLSKDGPYACREFPDFDLGPEAKELPYRPSGANMALRTSMFQKYGAFRTDMGANSGGEVPPMSEETEFGQRLLSAGEHFCYEPSAVAFRPVLPAEINKERFLAMRFAKGRAIGRESRIAPARVVFSLAAWTLRWMMLVEPPVRFFRRLVVWEKAGTVAGLHQQSQEAKKERAGKAEAIRRGGVNALDLKAGEWVEVRTQEEILATLDEHGRLGNLPFMPEMLQYCGKQFRVSKRADKTCNTIGPWSIRRMTNSVHLEGVRCDGEGHDGCQAACLIFWKEAWLKRATKDVVSPESLQQRGMPPASGKSGLYTVASLLEASSRKDWRGETLYSCQATELQSFTSYMRSWDPRQYIRDLRSGNLATGLAVDLRSHRALEAVLGILKILRVVAIDLFNAVQEKRHSRPPYPFLEGSATKTPREMLNLQPGELVQVRTREEIIATLDKQNKNRGMLFDNAMLAYSGGIYRVLQRVHRIVDERTGKMLDMKSPCIILEGVTCRWDYHRLCPRASYPYWRENWLKRAVDIPAPTPPGQIAETCEKS